MVFARAWCLWVADVWPCLRYMFKLSAIAIILWPTHDHLVLLPVTLCPWLQTLACITKRVGRVMHEHLTAQSHSSPCETKRCLRLITFRHVELWIRNFWNEQTHWMKHSDGYIRDTLKVCIFELAEKRECSIPRPSLLYKTHHGHLHWFTDLRHRCIYDTRGEFCHCHRNGWKTVRCWI